MFRGEEFVGTLEQLGVTHVIWLPDSAFGPWESALEASSMRLVRVCREGEAWPLAAGLQLGGKSPLVMMQMTGFYESGDALRNILFDLQVPLYAVLGARSWLVEGSRDSAKRFIEPILNAWGIHYTLIASADQKPQLQTHYLECRGAQRAGAALIAEGRM
jgi:sulfopyruvate decarboxylase TPP-binding subunit